MGDSHIFVQPPLPVKLPEQQTLRTPRRQQFYRPLLTPNCFVAQIVLVQIYEARRTDCQ
jgi:hypothetical protein